MNKKFSKVTQQQKELLKKVMNYFYNNGDGAPYRTDYIVVRMAQEATNDYGDVIFIPNYNNEDDFEFLTPFKCNAYASAAAKIITGSYDYRLAERFGIPYGEQISHVFCQTTMTDTIFDD